MQPMPHQLMGYDRAITMFSPDGRLLQVEYAKKTVRQGSTAIGIACKDGVVFVTDKRIIDKLMVPDSVEKIFKLDDHMGCVASGIISDARVLIERAQVKAQQHHVTYDSPMDTLTVVKDVCALKQVCTQSGGLRPFGVSLLIGGIDSEGPRLYETDPTGIFFQFKASVIGEGEPEIEEFLNKNYKDSISVEEGIALGLKALTKVIDPKSLTSDRVDIAYITVKDKQLTPVPQGKIDKYIKEAKKK